MGNQQARRMASVALGEVEPGNVVDESVSSPIRKPPLAPLTYGWVGPFLLTLENLRCGFTLVSTADVKTCLPCP